MNSALSISLTNTHIDIQILGFVYQTVWDIVCDFQAMARYVRREVSSLSLTGAHANLLYLIMLYQLQHSNHFSFIVTKRSCSLAYPILLLTLAFKIDKPFYNVLFCDVQIKSPYCLVISPLPPWRTSPCDLNEIEEVVALCLLCEWIFHLFVLFF